MASPTTWMSDNYNLLSSRTIPQILFFGTHDSGMSELHGTQANIWSEGTNTQTQTLDIHDQVVIAGARYLDVRPSYYKANGLSTVPSGNYLAHWSDFSSTDKDWVGLVGRALESVCTDLASAMTQLGPNELVLVELSHGAYLTESLTQTSLSNADLANILTPLITSLGPYLYKNADASVNPFGLTLEQICGSTGPKILMWSTSGSFIQDPESSPQLPYYTAADGFFSLPSTDSYFGPDGVGTTPSEVIAYWTTTLQTDLPNNPFFFMPWHAAGTLGLDLRDAAANINPVFQDTVANWFSTGILSATQYPSIITVDFVPADTSQMLDVCVALNSGTYTGLNRINVLHGQYSAFPPVTVEYNGDLYTAWTGTHSYLNMSCSSDQGASFGPPWNVGGNQAQGSPSLCVNGGDLYIAWTGMHNAISYAKVVTDGTTFQLESKSSVPNGSSTMGPALASLNGDLYIAWAGEHTSGIYVTYAPNGGMTFAKPGNASQQTSQPPSLAANNGTLFISWGGENSSDLYLGVVPLESDGSPTAITTANVISSVDGITITADWPSLASVGGTLYLAWGDPLLSSIPGSSQLAMVSFSGFTPGPLYRSSQMTVTGPNLCAAGQTLYFTWASPSDDDDYTLNIASYHSGS